jgi:TRAP-type C4-dicarboxylate transport system permease large subunit
MSIVCGMMVVILILGCLMDPLGTLLITLPFFMPLAEGAEINFLWFGVVMLLAIEIRQTTPPFGMLLFCMKGVPPPDTTKRDIYISVAPFILLEICILVFLILVPGVVAWLPEFLKGS